MIYRVLIFLFLSTLAGCGLFSRKTPGGSIKFIDDLTPEERSLLPPPKIAPIELSDIKQKLQQNLPLTNQDWAALMLKTRKFSPSDYCESITILGNDKLFPLAEYFNFLSMLKCAGTTEHQVDSLQ